MDDFLNRHSRRTWLVGSALTIIAAFFGLRFAVGLLAGLSFGEIHRRLKANYLSNMLFFREHKPFGSYLFFALGMIFLCLPLVLGAFYPEKVNMITAALGILLFKYEIFFDEIFRRRKEE